VFAADLAVVSERGLVEIVEGNGQIKVGADVERSIAREVNRSGYSLVALFTEK
jgi:hypothetical protein